MGDAHWREILLIVALLVLVSAACGRPPQDTVSVSGVALAGPVCPVETNPPDPACAPRPVVGAVVAAVSDSGERVEATTGPEGEFSFELAPGQYEVVAEPAAGLMETPGPLEVEVGSGPVDLGVLLYDTGIR